MITTLEKAQLVLNAPVAYPDFGVPPSSSAVALVPYTQQLPVSHHLRHRHAALQQLTLRQDLDVRYIGAAQTFTEPRMFQGKQSDWVLMNLTRDPLYYNNGSRLIAPKTVQQHLTALVTRGIEFDALFIAHELPKGYVQAGEQVPLECLIPPPPEKKMQRLHALQAITGGYLKGIQMGLTVSAVAAAAAVTTVAAAAVLAPLAIGGIALGAAFSLASGVDPILFGLLIDRTTPVKGGYAATWYYLTQWNW